MASHELVHELVYTFWSEDYITGIKSLLDAITDDITNIEKTIELTKRVNTEVIGKALRNLKDVIGANELNSDDQSLFSVLQQQQVKGLALYAGRLQSIENWDAENKHLADLVSLVFEFKEFYKDSKEILNGNYGSCSKRSAESRNYMDYCDKIHRAISKYSGNVEEDNEVKFKVPEILPEFPTISFPFELDPKFKFNDESNFSSFLIELQGGTAHSNRLVPFPGLPRQYFASEALFKALRKKDPHLDNSTFNLERIGQILLDKGIICQYNDVLGVKAKFESNDFYVWIPCEKMDTTVSKQEPSVRGKALFSDLLHRIQESRVNLPPLKSVQDLTRERKHLEEQNELYLKSCLALDLCTTQLEIELRKCMLQYAKMSRRKCLKLNAAACDFAARYGSALNVQFSVQGGDIDKELDRMYARNLGTVGFYTPGDKIYFKQFKPDRFGITSLLFSQDISQAVTDERGKSLVLQMLLTKLLEFSASEVAKAWSAPLDFTRVGEFRRDCLKEFHSSNGDARMAMETALAKRQRPVTELVGMIKYWLLELSDSLIPAVAYQDMLEGEIERALEKCPAESLANLLTICDHFQWLTEKTESGDTLTQLLETYSDFPVCHCFVRHRLRNPQHWRSLSRHFAKLLAAKDQIQKMHETRLKDVPKIPEIAAAHYMEPELKSTGHLALPQDSDTEFVPRPFKTSVVETTPVRPSSKRLSGINLLASTPSPCSSPVPTGRVSSP
ncbi:LAMI_0F15148g1_1 [Lachancea mirantina]|uniref:LAMI_0F15148g1_1 n=1 Tax=Lachancea mirantina TaxID=1230905 RepID=A0A1G4K467_9SACH|nr:LAMI_0F15148g1_1 [Lachancea mirantina]